MIQLYLTCLSIFYLFYLSVYNHWNAFTAIWVPKGFVNIITSPGLALFGIIYYYFLTTAFAQPPIIIHGLKTVCPPYTGTLAILAISWKPLINYFPTISCYLYLRSVDNPNIISKELIFTIPMAYKSERILQAEIFPNVYGFFTFG